MNAVLKGWIKGAARSPALRQCLGIYVCASVITFFLMLLLFWVPGVSKGIEILRTLTVLYLVIWLGPFDLFLEISYPDAPFSGAVFLLVAVLFAVIGIRVPSKSVRALSLYLSAVIWFAASVCAILATT